MRTGASGASIRSPGLIGIICWLAIARALPQIASVHKWYKLRARLTKLSNLWPASRLDELMPWAWAAEHSTNSLAA